MGETHEATVIRVVSRTFTVAVDGEELEAVVPKRLRWLHREVVDPVAVGDRVLVRTSGARPAIVEVLPRRNALSRPASGRRGKRQILAANLDHAVVVLAAADPPYKTSTIDRYLVLASANEVKPLLCINKIDLDPSVREDPDLQVYRDLGLEPVWTSARRPGGADDLARRLAGRTCVFIGPSGAGKSSLINALMPEADLRVGEISERTGKGTHTTTWVEMVELPCGGRLIDSPGIRVLDLTGLRPEDLARHFPDLEGAASDCRFRDCRHLTEPDCAVKQAVEEGRIAPGRYEAYRRIHASLEQGTG